MLFNNVTNKARIDSTRRFISYIMYVFSITIFCLNLLSSEQYIQPVAIFLSYIKLEFQGKTNEECDKKWNRKHLNILGVEKQ